MLKIATKGLVKKTIIEISSMKLKRVNTTMLALRELVTTPPGKEREFDS